MYITNTMNKNTEFTEQFNELREQTKKPFQFVIGW